jgi:hypothetical protein
MTTEPSHAHPEVSEGLPVALAELADSMPTDPDRLDAIHRRARVVRRRRQAGRAVGALAVGAATIAALVAIRTGPAPVVTVPASAPTSTAVPASVPTSIVLPACSAAPAEASAPTSSAFKGTGVVTAVTDETVTITPDPLPGKAGGENVPSTITAAITPSTQFFDAGTAAARPTLVVGQRVAFGAVAAAGGQYDLLILETHPDQAVTPAKKPAVTETTTNVRPDPIKLLATVVQVQAGVLTVHADNGPVTGEVAATLTADTIYRAGATTCTDPSLAPGQQVAVVLAATGTGYTVMQLDIRP